MSTLDHGLVRDVRNRLVADRVEPTGARLAGAVVHAGACGGDAVLGLSAALADEFVGLGPLAWLVTEPATTDVFVNGAGDVWRDRGFGLERVDVRFVDPSDVRRLAQRLVTRAGRLLDDAHPFADVRLDDGVRLHAVLPPIAPDGPLVSLRVPRRRAFTFDELLRGKALPGESAVLLDAVVRARLAFLVTGGTGTGKTTLLSTLLGLVDPAERVVLVEETAELRPSLPHVVRLQARTANAEGVGSVTLADLVRQTLRMRPDRIVVGEVRGGEVVDMLRAFNSGHDGGCGTLHANGIVEVPARIEALAAGAGIGRDAAHSLVGSALQVLVHLDRPAGVRRVCEIGILQREPGGAAHSVPAWSADAGRLPGCEPLVRLLADRGVEGPR